jgi:hypothetical protein
MLYTMDLWIKERSLTVKAGRSYKISLPAEPAKEF